jgi:putative acetyltransferase
MSVIIQHESPQQYQAVQEILLACFERETEGKLVAALRENGKVIFSLVAIQNDEVIGHVLFTPITTSPPSEAKGLGLAPLAVRPQDQRQGIGKQLVLEGLRLCGELGYEYVVLLGDPKYYQRFGFRKASSFEIQNEYGEDEPFMLIKLANCDIQKRLVKYCLEFSLFSL